MLDRDILIKELSSYSRENKLHKYKNKLLEVTPPLFRYRAINKNTFDELIDGYVYLASPIYFNDPYDCSYRLDNRIIIEKFRELLSDSELNDEESENFWVLLKDEKLIEFYNKAKDNKKISKKIKSISISNKLKDRENLGISCFSTSPNNILMWSHYANNHRGFCIEYTLKNNYDIFPVFYSKDLMLNIRKVKNSRYLLSTLIKCKTWDYESEYRIIKKIENEKQRKYKCIKIKSIYIGSKCSEIDRVIIEFIALKKKITVKTSRISDVSFEVVIDKDYVNNSDFNYEKLKDYIEKNSNDSEKQSLFFSLSDEERDSILNRLKELQKPKL